MQRFRIIISSHDLRSADLSSLTPYSIIMDVLESRDPNLVRLRRSGRLPTDFAVRPLERREGRFLLDVTTMSSELTRNLVQSVLEGSLNTRIGLFEVERIEVEDFDPHHVLSTSTPVRSFSVRFLTPTLLKAEGGVRGGVFVPMPVPARMLMSLMKIWNTFLGGMEDDRAEFQKWLESWGIVVSGLNIRTVKVEDRGRFFVGFKGWANFSTNDSYYDPEFLRRVDALMRLGEFTNVGGLRSKGFGVISYRRRDHLKQ
ncbi:MAG: CRISPR system precrRNA processing endoribonuclease RAMP protein Cas6 [Candidatus Korarchaeum sp.]|nr:CRISPR system precrRNA processing endoribonuclease RAMP protein Cas6 [Candidatus Korarchaeum sp.]